MKPQFHPHVYDCALKLIHEKFPAEIDITRSDHMAINDLAQKLQDAADKYFQEAK